MDSSEEQCRRLKRTWESFHQGNEPGGQQQSSRAKTQDRKGSTPDADILPDHSPPRVDSGEEHQDPQGLSQKSRTIREISHIGTLCNHVNGWATHFQCDRGSSSTDYAKDTVNRADTHSTSHTYGNFDISGSASVQIGDRHIHYGSTTQESSLFQAELDFKKALWYEGMEARKAQLEAVNPASMEWVWSQTSFPKWLEEGQGFYWISGKPASGKSTLFNYLIEHDRTKVTRALQRTHPNPLLLYFFFDFRSGRGMANSLVGLLRCLLHQLIGVSEQVKEYCLGHYGYRLPGAWPNDADQLCKMLTEALKRETRPICAFLDGLDEYQGDLGGLLDVLQRIKTSSQMKLCLASRYNSRIAQQTGGMSFKMEDHNSTTVRAYIDAAFSGLESLQLSICGDCFSMLKATIEHRAEGIILWVKFAVSALLDAFHNGDEVEDAMTRLGEVSTDLVELYSGILDRLSADQQMQAAIILFIVKNWSSHLNVHQEAWLGQIMVAFSILMDKVFGRVPEFNGGEDINRFRIRLYKLVGGFIDLFTKQHYDGDYTARLSHKTLLPFLNTNQIILTYHRDIEKSFKPECLASQVPVLVMNDACKAIDETAVIGPGDTYEWTGYLSRLPRRCAQKSLVYTWASLYTALLLDGMSTSPGWTCKTCDECVLNITQSWIYRKVSHSRRALHQRTFPTLSPDACHVWCDHPEVSRLMYYGKSSVLDMLLAQYCKDVPKELQDELRRHCEERMRNRS